MKNLPNDLMKANIDYMLGRSYEPIDENNLLKGEGSKGGKVIGHTKSGKAIYEIDHPSYKEFTKQERQDAWEFHKKGNEKAIKEGNNRLATYHAMAGKRFFSKKWAN